MPWNHIFTKAELEARYALTQRLDPAFAARERAFWESCPAHRLASLAAGAWTANDRDTYQMARSYAALQQGA